MKTTESAPADAPATSRKTKFSLAANYDPELVPALAAYPVDEVYGRLPTDGVSSGRPRYTWRHRSRKPSCGITSGCSRIMAWPSIIS